MGSNLGRMLAITLPLAGIGIAAPFLAPALLGGAAGAAGTAGATAGATGGATAGGLSAAATTPALAATVPAATAPTVGAGVGGGVAGATPGVAGAAPGAAVAGGGGAAGGAGAGGSITAPQLAQGIQSGTSLTSGLLNQQFNQPQMPTLPTIRAPVQSAAPMFSSEGIPSPVTGGLAANIPGPGASMYQGAGVPGNLGFDVANNLFSDQNPFAQYAVAA